MADPKGVAAEAADLDEEADDWEDAIDALIVALGELDGYVEAAFDPAKHARNPKGSPGGGKFRSMVDRLKEAITQHDGKGHPFDGFDREQLRRVAKARGIELKRGEDRDSIAKKLVGHLATANVPKNEGNKAAPKAVPKADVPKAGGKLEDSIKSGEKSSKILSASGTGTVRLVTFKNGSRGIKKTVHAKGEEGKRQVDAAQLSASIAESIGISTPAVHRNNDHEFYMEFLDGPTAYNDARMNESNIKILADSEAGKALGLFDLLIDYDDRDNRDNWAFHNNQIVALDHDTAWGSKRDPAKPPQEKWALSPFSDYWVSGKQWRANTLSPESVAAIRERLEKLRPQFVEQGRGAWLDFALSRLSAIAAHSTQKVKAGAVAAKFNPAEPREPHSGKWTGHGGGASKLRDALHLAERGDLSGETVLGSGRVSGHDGDVYLALTDLNGERRLRFGTPADVGDGTPHWTGNDELTAVLDDRSTGILRNGLDELDQMGRKRAKEADAAAAKMDAASEGSPQYKAAQDAYFAIAGDGQVIGEGTAHGDGGRIVVYRLVMVDEPRLQVAVRPVGAPSDWDVQDAVHNGEGALLDPSGFRRLRRQLAELTSTVQAAAGVDTHPGGEQLKHYWVYGEGAAKWSTWTELYHHLVKYLNPEMAKRTAAEWFHLRYTGGFWPGR
jgi:hypothetical protein